jgi:hypothetical protein
MVSERLQDFLTGFCANEEDLDETVLAVRAAPGSELATWLRPELRAAIDGQEISPDEAQYLMSRGFASSQDVAAWLNELYEKLFGR